MSYKVERKISLINFFDTNRSANDIKFIVWHYVGAKGTAKNNADYFYSVYREASAHYFIPHTKEESIWQVVEENDAAWHCGGGLQGTGGHSYFNICTNLNSIGIELCVKKVNGVWTFSQDTLDMAVEFGKDIKKKYPNAIHIRHFDVTGKICPEPFVRDELAWNNFLARINGGSVEPTPTPTPEPTPTNKLHVYKINDVQEKNGIWQLRSNYLVPVDFTWTDNGIPLDDIWFTDVNGNKLSDQEWRNNGTQKYFVFRVGSVKAETGLIKGTGGYYWIQFESDNGDGILWLSCDNLDDLYYRAYDNGQ